MGERLPQEVFVFVRRGDELLVLRRSREPGGYWHIVSGALETGETYAQAAGRELREETGLDAEIVDLGRSYTYEPEAWEPHYVEGGPPIRVESFLAEAPAGWEPTLDWEHDDYRWCDAASAAWLLYWPEPRALVLEIGARCAS
jgi:ADP-ribose pyrophosphatase YjhB (NUDIX family)